MPVKEKTKPARKAKPSIAKAKAAKACLPSQRAKAPKFKRPSLFEAAKKSAQKRAKAAAVSPAIDPVALAKPHHPTIDITAPREVHPAANLLPMMTQQELDALRSNIQDKGVQDPIAIYKGQILDGRNRFKVCVELGINPPVVYLPDDTDPVQYVYSKAVHRNLNDSQKAAAAVCIKQEMAKDAERRMKAGVPVHEGPKGRASDLAGTLFGVTGRYIDEAEALLNANPKLFQEVFEGRLYLSRAKAMVNREKVAAEQTQAIEALNKSGNSPTKDAQIIHGDCIEELYKLAMRDVRPRLIFADPPYNQGVAYGGAGEEADRLPDDEYLQWCEDWIGKCARMLADDGSFFLMCSGEYSDQIGMLMRAHNLHRRNCIAWTETFGNYTEGNMTNCWRPIHYYTKRKEDFVWNKDTVRVKSWRNENGDARAVADGKVPSNVWNEFPRIVGNNSERQKLFPTQLPQALLERIILLASDPGDLVLDPFNGSGTTGVAAILNSRRYIGIEKYPQYVAAARTRLANTTATLT